MNNKPKRKLKDLSLFDPGKIEIKGNRVKPCNEFIRFKKEDIEQSIGSCFEQRAATYADRIAVKYDDRCITYGFLNRYARRVAGSVFHEYDDRYRLSEAERTRYSRQLLLHGWGTGAQEKLKSTVVFAAGAGGSGSALLQQLALVGIGTIIICDFDEVELSNLNRQVLHDESRIGMNKALSAKKTLNIINPHVNVIAYTEKITRENIEELAGEAQIIFDNVDDLEAKFVLSEYAVKRQIPHILSSMIDINAYALVLHSPYTPCFHCLYDREILEKIETIKAYTQEYKKSPNPVASPALFLSTGYAVNEAIKIILGFENPNYNRYILFNQRGAQHIADSDGYRRLIYPFTEHFKKLSRQQGKDWDRGWQGQSVEEIRITPDPECPLCRNLKNDAKPAFSKTSKTFLPGGPGGAVFTKKSPPWPPEAKATGPWQAVALLFGHGIEMIAGLLGVLKSGKTYIPLDPTYPLERLEYMLEDSEARIIVTERKHHELAQKLINKVNQNIKIINIEEIPAAEMNSQEPEVTIQPGDVAYVLYTSGSTGAPKGVMQSHRNVLHFARVYTNALHIHEGDRLTLFSSYSFDAAKMDIFGALLNGAILYPFDIKQEGSLERLSLWLKKERITIYHSIPTVYRYFIRQLSSGSDNNKSDSGFPGMRFIVLGGEAVYKNDIQAYKTYFPDDCLFINGLGPTESTVTLQYFIDKNTHFTREAVAVGYPVEETEVFLLDSNDRETVVNAVGEIVYKSDYLALGYLKKPEKTNQVFVNDPRSDAETDEGTGRVYRSGDLGRRLEDGSIEYAGRKDFQVKVRGYRIELAEIESKLDRFEQISKSVVVCQQDSSGENYLTAFYSSSGGLDIDESSLVQHLKESLPDYMIPSGFYRLEEFPYTPTGKIDRKALTDSNMVRRLNRVVYTPPRNEIEKKLVEIWTRVLDKHDSPGPLGIDDNFFVWGGNSLKAILLTSGIHKELDVKVSLAEVFKSPTIRELTKYILQYVTSVKEPGSQEFSSINPAEKKEYYPLSSAQSRFYILQQVTPESTAYNMTQVHQLEGSVARERFEDSFRKMIDRHAVLRTSFRIIAGRPVQRIHEKVEFELKYYDLRETETAAGEDGEGEAGKQGEATGAIIKRFSAPFDLAQAPLLQFGLIDISEDRYILMFRMHHIVSDGTSMAILLREFMDIYSNQGLQPLRLQYKDFAHWQFDRLYSGKLIQQEAYWTEQFCGELPILNMPVDFPRPPVQSFAGHHLYITLEKSLTREINRLGKNTGTTLFMILLAVYNILLSRYTGQEDIIIGTTVAGRWHSDLEQILGLMIETLALRNYPQGEQTFTEFLNRVKQSTLGAYDNQEYPFKELIKKLGAENEISRNPVFDAMLIVQNIERTAFRLKGLSFSPFRLSSEEAGHMSKVDFTIEAMPAGEEIYCKLEYCTALYRPETMERLSGHFINILREVVREPEMRLSGIQMIDERERKQLLEEFNHTSHEYKPGKRVYELLADRVKQSPDHIAVIEDTGMRVPLSFPVSITYKELEQKSDQLACLLKEKGIGNDALVAIMVEPSVEMVIGLWGILKSGGAYLPIEPDYPGERIHYILKDSKVKILVNKSNNFSDLFEEQDIELFSLDDVFINTFSTGQLSSVPVSAAHTNSLAYVIYTSGSTGRPKGVLVGHTSLSTYIDAFEREFNPDENDTVVQNVSYAFDAFVEELYPVLLKGGKLAIPGKETVRDLPALVDFIVRHRVTMITCSPQLLDQLNVAARQLTSLRLLISGGDRLKGEYIDHFLETGDMYRKVYNTYGPTETTVCATYYRCLSSTPAGLPANVPIGKPIHHYLVYITDGYGNLLPVGVTGELAVAGKGLARGYLNRVELTFDKFIKKVPGKTFNNKFHMSAIYRTGDLGQWMADGNIQFMGRLDRQVKIRGYRIELGEIENQLMGMAGVKQAVVVESARQSGHHFLAAYVVCKDTLDVSAVKDRLSRQLPSYMVPPYILQVDALPITSSGKVDVRRLPSPLVEVRTDRPYAAPESRNEKIVTEIWKDILELDRVGLTDNFFDLGGTSLDIFQVNTRLEQAFQKKIPIVAMFQHSTVQTLVQYLEREEDEQGIPAEKQQELKEALDKGKQVVRDIIAKETGSLESIESKEAIRALEAKDKKQTGLEIAVIGMAGKFPGSRDINEFWENLKNGVEGIGFFTEEELQAEGIAGETLRDEHYIKARGVIDDAGYFDAAFFGYTPREAQLMDPQIRVFAQCTWHALEDAGYDPFSYNRRIGLYAGASPNLQWEALTMFSSAGQGLSSFMTRQLTDKDFMCTHISYKLNLQGPSYAVQTACSTALVAIHWAVQGLLLGECEMALAGGASITYPFKRGYVYQPGMIHSADGHNKSFASDSSGSVFGDGVGAVVLKKLADALTDGDHIYAIIKGTATNNDGLRKVGYTAPSVAGQAQVIKTAQLMAELEAETITYIEAHGTATPLGDSVEMEALKQAFHTDKKEFCIIGTVKSNVGHLYSAAGAAGFIKTALALKHRLIPPSLHFNTPNPQIDFKNSPFQVNTELKEWRDNNGLPLRAGVSSFGIGGTNAHVILEEAPMRDYSPSLLANPVIGKGREHQLILLSARTPTALDKQSENLLTFLSQFPDIDMADLAYTLQVGRKSFPLRRMFLCTPGKTGEGTDRLPVAIRKTQTAVVKGESMPVFFMFCGQGSQYVNMGIDLYRSEAIFREEMDRCFEILKPLMDVDLKDLLYPSLSFSPSSAVSESQISAAAEKINRTEITQPVVFAFEYALAKLLITWGIKPDAMIGYSLGEYIAACISGVISLADALKLIVIRGQLMRQTPQGAMTSVPLPEKELKPLLTGNLSLAIVNGPTCIVSGPAADIAEFEEEMKKKRVLCVGLNISQAMHSSLMNPIKAELENMIKLKDLRFHKPRIPYISNVTADWLTGEETRDPAYWGAHLCSTVRFSDGLKKLMKEDNAVFIEIGPGRILGMMVRVHPDKKPGHVIISTLKHQQEKAADDFFLMEKLGQLWLHGLHIDWPAFYRDETRYRVSLPGYPFEGKTYIPELSSIEFATPAVLSQIDGVGDRAGQEFSAEPMESPADLPGENENYIPPQSEMEKRIACLWQEFLGVNRVGIQDNFFFLNGNSLLATQLMARIMEEYPVEIPMNRFYEQPTIAHLTGLIKELQE